MSAPSVCGTLSSSGFSYGHSEQAGCAPLNGCHDSGVYCFHGGEGSSLFLEGNHFGNNLKKEFEMQW